MATNNNKPDLSDLKARLGLKKPGAPAGPGGTGPNPAVGSGQHGAMPRPGGPAAGGPAAGGPASGGPGAPAPAPAAQPASQSGAHGAIPASNAPAGSPTGSFTPPAAVASGMPLGQAAPIGQPAAPAGAAPGPRPGPPAGAAPPPAAARPAASARSNAAARPAGPDLSTIKDAIELPEDIEIPGSSVFSKSVLVVIVSALALGLIFGYIFASSQQHRSIDNSRTADARNVRDNLKPRVDAFNQLAPTIEALSPGKVDFEAATRMAETEFAVGGNILGGNRLLLGPELVTEITNYIADSTLLGQMLAQHNRLTNTVDREELEKLLEENEALTEGVNFAVVFDYRDLIRRGGDDNYQPKLGRLVTISNLERDEEGKFEFTYLNSTRTDKSEAQGLIPLQRGDILRSAGDNALQRYERRVQQIQEQARKMSTYSPRLIEKLNELADRPPAALIKFSS